jgi:hypothetical protein
MTSKKFKNRFLDYTDGFGRPSKEIFAALGVLILQQLHDLTDEEIIPQFSFNLQWHFALNISGESDEVIYFESRKKGRHGRK